MSWYAPKFFIAPAADLSEALGTGAFRRGTVGTQYDDATDSAPVELTSGLFDSGPAALHGHGAPLAQTLAGQLDAAAVVAEPGNPIEWSVDIVGDDRIRLFNDSAAFTVTNGAFLGFTDGASSAPGSVGGVAGHVLTASSRWSRAILQDQELRITEARVDPTPDLVYDAPYTPRWSTVLRLLRRRGSAGGPDDGVGSACIEALDQAAHSSSSPAWMFDEDGHTVVTWADGDSLDDIVWPRADDDPAWGSTWLRDVLGFRGDETSIVVTTDRGDMRKVRSTKRSLLGLRTSRTKDRFTQSILHHTEGGRRINGEHATRVVDAYTSAVLEFDLDGPGRRLTYDDLTDHAKKVFGDHLPPGGNFEIFFDWPGDMRRYRSPVDVNVDQPAHDTSYTSHRHPMRGRLRLARGARQNRLQLKPEGTAERFVPISLQVDFRDE